MLEAAGLNAADLRPVPWEKPIWRFETPNGAGVLKVKDGRQESSLRWEMDLLRSIGTRFPAPTPLDLFDGKPWMFVRTEAWLTHTYLPGETFGWGSATSLSSLGAFIASYHEAVAGVDPAPRPGAHGVRAFIRAASALNLETVLDSADGAATFRRLADALPDHFDRDAEWIAIHGDFTVDNVLIDPRSRRCSGVIDFDMAQLAPRVADLAWSAWRSARTSRDARTLVEERLRDLVIGYSHESATKVDPEELLDWLTVRGLLWVAIVAGRGERYELAQTALARTIWIANNREALIAAASP